MTIHYIINEANFTHSIMKNSKRNSKLTFLMDEIHRPIYWIDNPNRTIQTIDLISKTFFRQNQIIWILISNFFSKKLFNFTIHLCYKIIWIIFCSNFSRLINPSANHFTRFFYPFSSVLINCFLIKFMQSPHPFTSIYISRLNSYLFYLAHYFLLFGSSDIKNIQILFRNPYRSFFLHFYLE